MTRRSKTSYLSLTQTRFPDNTTGAVDPLDERNDRQDIADSFTSYEDDAALLGSKVDTLDEDSGITALNRTVLVDTTAEDIDVELPSAVDMPGHRFEILKVDASANVVNIIPDGSETISGEASVEISVQWSGLCIQSDGTNWVILSNLSLSSGGDLTVDHLTGSGGTPGNALGGGAGSGGPIAITVTGNDLAGLIDLTTGSTPPSALTAIVTLNFVSAYANAPVMILYPANEAAALLGANAVYAATTTSTGVIQATTVPLAGSTQYKWFYHIIGK